MGYFPTKSTNPHSHAKQFFPLCECVAAMYSNIGIEPNGTGGVSRFWLNDFDINLMHSCDQ